jgi:hypothetical protein
MDLFQGRTEIIPEIVDDVADKWGVAVAVGINT